MLVRGRARRRRRCARHARAVHAVPPAYPRVRFPRCARRAERPRGPRHTLGRVRRAIRRRRHGVEDRSRRALDRRWLEETRNVGPHGPREHALTPSLCGRDRRRFGGRHVSRVRARPEPAATPALAHGREPAPSWACARLVTIVLEAPRSREGLVASHFARGGHDAERRRRILERDPHASAADSLRPTEAARTQTPSDARNLAGGEAGRPGEPVLPGPAGKRHPRPRGAVSGPKLTVLSFGAGQDSTALAVLFATDRDFRRRYAGNGDLIAVMSETGNEFPETLEHVETMRGYFRRHGIPFDYLGTHDGNHTGSWRQGRVGFYEAHDAIGSKAFPKTCSARP